MPISQKAITNFTSGELDPRLYGRTDIEQYGGSAKYLRNVVVEWYGGATRTPGTYFVCETKYSEKESRLIPFEFSTIQAYTLEFGDQYIRFYKDRGQIVTAPNTPYEVTTPYLEADIWGIRYAQSADVQYLVHPDYRPRSLTRSGHTSWTLATFVNKYGPLLDLNTTSTTITPSAATGTGITLTASSAIFSSDHIGSVWKVNEGYVEIKTVTAGALQTTCTADVLYSGNLGGTSAYTTWQEAAWSDYRGWPSYVTFYEQRLCFACTAHQPNGEWLSKPFEYDNFEGGSDDDDALKQIIAAKRMNKIQWVEPIDFLAVGNAGGVNRTWSGSENTPMTPLNANTKPILNYGCDNTEPIVINGVVHYVQNDGRTIRALQYSLDRDIYTAGDITLLSRHITEAGVKEMSYQQAPHSILFAVLDSGDIATCTIDIDQKIVAWALQSTDGSYESIATIPAGTYDETWAIVNRTINGETKRYIEYFKPFEFTDQEDAFFVHSGLTYDGAATTSITGLDHLEGKTVAVLADGYVQPNKEVTEGAITLDRSASVVQVGLPYTSIIETNVIEAGSAIGSAQGKYKKMIKAIIKLYRTIGGKAGVGSSMDTITYEKPPSLFTGNKEVILPKGWDKNLTVKITQEQPLPLTVSGIYPYMDTND